MVRVNFRLLLRLVLALTLTVGAVYGLYAYQSKRIPEAILWQANNAADLGKTDDAVKYIRRYLELKPDDYDQTMKLAELVDKRATSAKDLTNALYLYEKVMREAPNRTDAAKKFVYVCVRLGRQADGLRVADELVKRTPEDGELLGYMAECLVAQNKLPEARQKFDDALKFSPQNVRAHEQYARLLMFKLNAPKDALAVLDLMVKANPYSADAHLLRARSLHLDKDETAAMRDLDRVFWLDPENVEALLLSAEIEQVRGESRKARETLLAMLDTVPRDVRGYRALSWLNLIGGNSVEAMQTLERGLTRMPDAPELLTPLGDLCLDLGDVEKVADIIKRLESKPTSGTQAKYMRSRLLMKQGKHKAALAILEPLRAEVLSLPAVEQQVSLMLAACHERCGDPTASSDILKRMLSNDPSNLPARVAMANLLLDAGQLTRASEEYEIAARSPIAGFGVRTMSAKLRMKRLLADPKTKPEDWANFEDKLRDLIKAQPNAIDPVVILAEARAAQNKVDDGIAVLRDACRARPADSRLWMALANLAWKEKGAVRAEEILNEARAITGDSVEWKLTRAALLTSGYEPIPLEQLTGSMAQLSETERIRLWQGLADIFNLSGMDEEMLKACREMARLSSRDVYSRQLLYIAALKANDSNQMQRWGNELKEDIAVNGESVVTLAKALVDSTAKSIPAEQWKEWGLLASQMVLSAPELPDAHWLLARVTAKTGEAATAAKLYANVNQMDPLNAKLVAERLNFLKASNQTAEFERLSKSVRHDPRFSQTRRAAIARMSGISLGELSAGNADRWTRVVIESAPSGLESLTRTLQQAENALGRATYLQMLAAVRRPILAKCPEWKPDLQGSDERRTFAAACLSHAEFLGQPGEALPVLSALAKDMNAKADDVAWATLAESTIRWQLGEESGAKADVADVKKLLERKPNSIGEHRNRVKGLTAAFRGVEGQVKEQVLLAMLESLKELAADPSSTVGDWYQLSQVYRGIGDRANARKCLAELLKREPNNLQYLAINVEEMLSDGRLEEVEQLIPSLQPGVHDLRIASVLARFLTMVNDVRGVLETTDKFVKAVDAGTSDYVIRQRQAAELLDQLARLSLSRNLSGGKILLEGACERYRAVSNQYPEAVAGWVGLLSLAGQSEKAFEELERRQQKMSPPDLASAGMRTLRDGTPTEKQFQIVLGWLNRAMTDDPKSVTMLLEKAEWHTLQVQYAAAAQVYRRVLELDPKQIVALNNLAWILSADTTTSSEALKLADKAIQLAGVNPDILDTRARILISTGQFAEAKQSLRESLNVSQSALRYFHMALWHHKQDQRDEAKSMMREAVRLGVDLRQVHPSDRALCQQLMAGIN